PARDDAGPPRNTPPARLQPPVDGGPRFRPAGAEGDQSDPALRRDARARPEGARARISEHQHGPDLRTAFSNAANFRVDDRESAGDRSGPPRGLLIRQRSVDEEASESASSASAG